MTLDHPLLDPLRRMHERMRALLVEHCEKVALRDLSAVDRDDEGDTIFAVDRVIEDSMIHSLETEVAPTQPLVLIAEGVDRLVLPRGTAESDAKWRVIIDPIDGTRELMVQKRSAWILTGVAPNRGDETSLSDIEVAVQTEVPLVKQHLCDMMWAVKGKGAEATRTNRLNGESQPLSLVPSQEKSIEHGFATVARFFPGARDILAKVDDELAAAVLGPIRPGKAQCFEDQYLSTGGQLYEMMAGHDRFIADLRPLTEKLLQQRGSPLGICCHPYDLCTELVARELGVIVCDPHGHPVDCPLDLESEVAWMAFANESLRELLYPALVSALQRNGLWE